MPMTPPEVKLVWSEGFPSVSGYYFAWVEGSEIVPIYFSELLLTNGQWPFKKISGGGGSPIWPNYPNAFTHAWTHFAPMPGKTLR